MGRKEKRAARKTALLGVLFALAAVLSLGEGALAPALGLPPGVKPGLANTVVMFALLFLGLPQAACLAVLKALLALLARGAVAGALSLCGGLFSVGVMWLLHRFARPTPFILSAGGRAACGVRRAVGCPRRAGTGMVCAGAGGERAGHGGADGAFAARAGARIEKSRFFQYY